MQEPTEEFLQETLGRLRIKLRDAQDSMDVISFAIKALERDLEVKQQGEVDETNEKEV
jgi:hypothetical protein